MRYHKAAYEILEKYIPTVQKQMSKLKYDI